MLSHIPQNRDVNYLLDPSIYWQSKLKIISIYSQVCLFKATGSAFINNLFMLYSQDWPEAQFKCNGNCLLCVIHSQEGYNQEIKS